MMTAPLAQSVTQSVTELIVVDNGSHRNGKVVSMRQAQLALMDAGKLDIVKNAIANMPGELGDKARIEWAVSSFVERDTPLVAALTPVLGMSDQQMDALFMAASIL